MVTPPEFLYKQLPTNVVLEIVFIDGIINMYNDCNCYNLSLEVAITLKIGLSEIQMSVVSYYPNSPSPKKITSLILIEGPDFSLAFFYELLAPKN